MTPWPPRASDSHQSRLSPPASPLNRFAVLDAAGLPTSSGAYRRVTPSGAGLAPARRPLRGRLEGYSLSCHVDGRSRHELRPPATGHRPARLQPRRPGPGRHHRCAVGLRAGLHRLPDDCLSEPQVAELVKCIRRCLDCADSCTATLRVLSRQTEYDANLTRPQLQACVAACTSCGDECGRHAGMHAHCRVCAEACRRCQQACTQLLTAMT